MSKYHSMLVTIHSEFENPTFLIQSYTPIYTYYLQSELSGHCLEEALLQAPFLVHSYAHHSLVSSLDEQQMGPVITVN